MIPKFSHKIPIRSVISFFIVALFAFQVAICSLYTHSHQLADGRIITHAHLYNKKGDSKPFKTHHHLQNQIFFHSQLRNLFPAFFLCFYLFAVISPFYFKKQKSNIPVSLYITSLRDRGPPSLS